MRQNRLLLCAGAGVALVWLAGELCPGRDISLWEKYGPWVQADPVRSALLAAAALYALSLVLWPEEKEEPGYSPCT